MATLNVPARMSLSKPGRTRTTDRLASSRSLSEFIAFDYRPKRRNGQKQILTVRSMRITQQSSRGSPNSPIGPLGGIGINTTYEFQSDNDYHLGQAKTFASGRRKTKIVCTIGPSTSSREMIWKLAETGMNVARLNMSHGDHASHQKTIDLVKEYNSQFEDKVIAIMLDTKGPEVRSGDVPQAILLTEGQEFNFTIKRGVSTKNTVSVNYDDFVNDVEVGDIVLVDGKHSRLLWVLNWWMS